MHSISNLFYPVGLLSKFDTQGRGVHSPWDNEAFPITSPISEHLLGSQRKFRKLHFSVGHFPKNVFSSAKISDDLFLVIDSKFHITNFPLKGHPIFHVLKFLNPLKCKINFFPF